MLTISKMFTFLPTLPVQLEVWKFAIWSDIFVQSIQRFRWKSTEELCLMTLKSYAKFEEKLTCGFKYDMRNLVNIHPTTQKSKNFTPMGYFCPKYMRFELKNRERSYLSWHWTVMQNLRNPDIVVSKMAWRIGWTFIIRAPKSLKIVHWWALFVQSIYCFS